MTGPGVPIHDHDDMEECMRALRVVRAFLHGELPETEADRVRRHPHTCGRCMESFEIEYAITEMIRRSQPITVAPTELRNKLTTLCLSLWTSPGKPCALVPEVGERGRIICNVSGVWAPAMVGLTLMVHAALAAGPTHQDLLLRVATAHYARCPMAPPAGTVAE